MPSADRDAWTTPVHVWHRALLAVGGPAAQRYDVDPASNAQSTVPAWASYRLDHEDPDLRDGLAHQCGPGDVAWLNPPYSDPLPWARWAVRQARAGAHVCGLVRLAPDTEWWQDYGPTVAWAPRGRIRCSPPPGATESSPRYVMTPCLWTEDDSITRMWLTAHQGGVLLTRQEPWQ